MWRSFLRGNEPQATDLAKNVARRRRLSSPEHIPFVKRSAALFSIYYLIGM